AVYVSTLSLAVAVLGFTFGFWAELASQRKAIRAAEKSAAEAHQVVLGLSRILSRFDTIDVEQHASLDLEAPAFSDVKAALLKRIPELDGANVGESYDGLRLLTWSASHGPGVFSFDDAAVHRWLPTSNTPID